METSRGQSGRIAFPAVVILFNQLAKSQFFHLPEWVCVDQCGYAYCRAGLAFSEINMAVSYANVEVFILSSEAEAKCIGKVCSLLWQQGTQNKTRTDS